MAATDAALAPLALATLWLAAGAALAAPPPAGDARRGETLFDSYCSDCHGLIGVRMGPSLVGVVGRKAASLPSYGYSAALEASDLTWTPATLDRFLAGPREMAPGTSMEALHLAPRDRRDVIAYLASLKPPPLRR
jgi:cytochrome c